MSIKFGTDGWRAKINDDFTFANIEKIVQAWCYYKSPNNEGGNVVYVAYDTRELSYDCAKIMCCVLAANKFNARLLNEASTPILSYEINSNAEAIGGFMVTASHNSWEWNGVKIKDFNGVSIDYQMSHRLEDIVNLAISKSELPKTMNFEEGVKCGLIYEVNGSCFLYAKAISEVINIGLIEDWIEGYSSLYENPVVLVHDAMWGCGKRILSNILGGCVDKILNVNCNGKKQLQPEPIESNLEFLKQSVRSLNCEIGFATDGDADRLGVFDETGNYVDSQKVFGLLLLHNIVNRGLRGTVVKTVSVGQLIDRICSKYDLWLHTVPVGFKNVSAQLMASSLPLMGGEESGGFCHSYWINERDGVFNALLILELLARTKKTLSKLVDEMEKEFGKFLYIREDLQLTNEQADKIRKFFALDVYKIIEKFPFKDKTKYKYDKTDGLKIFTAEDSWFLFRLSGTEPVLRIYVEATDKGIMLAIMDFAKSIIDLINSEEFKF